MTSISGRDSHQNREGYSGYQDSFVLRKLKLHSHGVTVKLGELQPSI